MKDLYALPDDLPVPIDDGACDHLVGMRLPAFLLQTTSDQAVNLCAINGTVVIFCYPMTGNPTSPPMVGWNDIPGARGCTPQACAYRDHYQQLVNAGVALFGTSAQPLAEQKQAVDRLNLPFALINDSSFKLTDFLNLPTFTYQGEKMLRRLTLISVNGLIQKVFYPVFPPNKNVNDVLLWLHAQKT